MRSRSAYPRLTNILLSALLVSSSILLSACSSHDQQQTREEMQKAGEKAKEAGAEIKKDAKEAAQNISREVQPDTRDASQKLAEGKDKLLAAGDKASAGLSQAALVAQVKTKLAADTGLSTVTNIDVHASGGVVTLTGHVATQAQKDTADHAAALVDGVTRVQNNLTVDR